MARLRPRAPENLVATTVEAGEEEAAERRMGASVVMSKRLTLGRGSLTKARRTCSFLLPRAALRWRRRRAAAEQAVAAGVEVEVAEVEEVEEEVDIMAEAVIVEKVGWLGLL